MPPPAPSTWFQQEDLLLAEVRRTARAASPSAPSIPGYSKLEEIGRGGQGIVYSAIQTSTSRRVAIKVLLDGALASGAARRRFEREIELVASLRHPGIVGVFDSGLTSDGRLYCVMEFLPGRSLADLAASPCDPRTAADLLAQIADAVHHAHQRGVIHRDLKPSNVRIDDAGHARVLDFGLAKLAGDSPAPSPQVSITGQFMGSIPWASPEQASSAGDPAHASRVDTRSDIYSLGVVLYQLLTARFPYDVSSGIKVALDNITAADATPIQSLVPGIAEDLATVVHTALAKDPARRYQSAGALAADLRHVLAGEPIAARRDSAWYTVSRSLRRYRLAAVAGALVLAASLVALLITRTALNDARSQRDLATAQSQSARAVAKFVEDMLGAADPGKDAKEVRVVDLLRPASGLVDQNLKGQPAAQAMVRSVLSSAFRNLQFFNEAEREATLGLEVAERDLNAKGLEAARLRTTLGAALVDLGQRERGLEQAKQALALATAEAGPDSPAAIEAAMTVAYALDELQRLDESEALKRDILARASRALGQDSQEALGAAGNLGRTLYQQGKLDETISLLEPTVARARAVLGPDNIAALAPISTLASAYSSTGQREKAEPLLKDAWERLQRTYGPDSPSTLIYANNYAILLHNSGRSAEAKPILEDTLAKLTKVYGPEHPRVIGVLSSLGSVEGELGDNTKQLGYQSRALAIADKTLGRTHRSTVYIRNNYASTLGTLKRYDEAIAEYRACAADADQAFPLTDSMPPAVRFNLAKNLHAAGQTDEALTLLRAAAPKLLETLGPKSDWTTEAFDLLIKWLEEKGLHDEANKQRAALATPAK